MHAPPTARTAPESVSFWSASCKFPREAARSFPVAVRFVLFPVARFRQCRVRFDEQLTSAPLALVRCHLMDVSTQTANKALLRIRAPFCAHCISFIHAFIYALRPPPARIAELGR